MKIKQYKGLKAVKKAQVIADAQVAQELENIRRQRTKVVEITNRAAQNGDEVIIDYAGFVGDFQFPGGSAENQPLTLGSGMFIPGFEEQLLDKVCGEEVTVKVTFPKEYHAAELAGKDAEFKCVIHQIRVKTSYEMDDVFAKEVGGCETLEQMQQKMKESMQAYTDERAEMDLQDRLLNKAAETLEFTCSSEEVEAAVNEQMKSFEAQLSRQGLSVEMYCSFMNTTVEALRADAEPTAKAMLRNQAAIFEICKLEDLEATQEEIGEAVAVIARQNDMTVEQLKPYYNAEFEAAVTKSVLTGKVMALIREHANVTVV